jgi:prepilin peptidase CpaA
MVTLATLTTVLFAGMLTAAMVMDLRTRRIPNRLTLAGVAAGLALRALGGADPLVAGSLAVALALAIGLPLFALGAMGAGDVKLLAAVGAFMGPAGFLTALLVSALVGGVLGIAVSVRRGVILPVLLGSKALALRAITLGRYGERTTLETPGAVTVPYGVAIGIGSLIAWLL